MKIRNARPGESPAVWDLVLASYLEFGIRMEPERWAMMLTNLRLLVEQATPEQLLVGEAGSKLVGTVSYYAANGPHGTAGFTGFPPEWAVMRVLAVPPEFQGRGYGRMLAAEVVERARSDGATAIGLHTSELMTYAVNIYTSLGFERQESFRHLGLSFGLYKLDLTR